MFVTQFKICFKYYLFVRLAPLFGTNIGVLGVVIREKRGKSGGRPFHDDLTPELYDGLQRHIIK